MANIFSSLKKAYTLLKNVDFEKFSNLDETQLQGLMKLIGAPHKERQIPPVEGDFYHLGDEALKDEDRALQLKVRAFLEKEVKPIVNKYWLKAAFPFELIPKIAELNICGLTYQGYGCMGKSNLMEGMLAMEMARIDTSISTFFGVQSGLAMGSIYLLGSEAQKQEWLPDMQQMKIIGAFGLTEPEVGSGVAGGLTTTAKRNGSKWILNGQKKWIGNATFSDVTIIWARDVDDNQVKGFLVRKGTTGFAVEKMQDKMALRIVQNGLITLTNCEVDEEDRLQNANSFKDTAKVLKMTRAGVAWQAVGCARGAYESALSYTTTRKQFGRPIASYQLIQNHLVEMLSNLTAMQTLCFRLSQLQDQGLLTDAHASLAKVFCSMRTRDVVSRAREVMGGNGILLEYDVARFVADAEAIYSYEGTKEINTLIVGRAITGFSAFV
ncbi:acyl-CoA dehydrogenase family protein [Pedobacter hiemivivus]|uniref:Acyl-CoA dehydrogenase n=1 Tax=Pedobacter hiemivivus TaxID=2530454 RepID=A0A4R0N9B3_9SPHI|nr:acyl-CoA dehydrogenase family protein [Pedobacter hiemivivus]TCC96655.1 acyl-CoA dehydrogenase [Pedobacter hiemivivus]